MARRPQTTTGYRSLPLPLVDESGSDIDGARTMRHHPLRPHLPASGDASVCLESHFDPVFTAQLALREKQIQQNYRPIIGIHKWFARRPGTVFRNLLLAEFNGAEPLESSYWRAHQLTGVIADPFMGGGTPLFEANRLGFSVIGADINPMAYWVVRQSLGTLDVASFAAAARRVAADVERDVGALYHTQCEHCGREATVKYFLWVKVAACPMCATDNDLFPGYLIAEATRHPQHVLVCGACGALNEYAHQPNASHPEPCARCGQPVQIEGPARRHRVRCRSCSAEFAYPSGATSGPPKHRLFALEYHCASCKPSHIGRFFKQPDCRDLELVERAEQRFAASASSLPIPDDAIPSGDETNRLHRWGYHRYREMFSPRQLLGLGLLLQRIQQESGRDTRHALLTVFSDILRYQNLLCRYDTYALKCQDIFSVHGFPVGLIQCENNLLGIPRVGSGSFRHFVEKYLRAKAYCEQPFETRQQGRRKQQVPIIGERIAAEFVQEAPGLSRQAWLHAAPADEVPLANESLDGVFTDPPYFDNVQYAELMDFCYVWLRQALADEVPAFRAPSTRAEGELTGNATLGRGLEHFAAGMAEVFAHYAEALKPGAPFVFTYHHNDAAAYVPLIVAILDAGLDCTATLPAPAEMGASLHIAGTGSSSLDSVFVCRRESVLRDTRPLEIALAQDVLAMTHAGVRVTAGDRRCLQAGHVARLAINQLRESWNTSVSLAEKMQKAQATLARVAAGGAPDTPVGHGRRKERVLAAAV